MKSVLCFGDSNTWGYDPDASLASPFPIRHPHDVRWTGVLARELGAGWRVIEEGQNGRTTVFEDPLTPHRKGLDYLPAALESHKPLDAVVLMLGTNDLKVIFSAPANQIAKPRTTTKTRARTVDGAIVDAKRVVMEHYPIQTIQTIRAA